MSLGRECTSEKSVHQHRSFFEQHENTTKSLQKKSKDICKTANNSVSKQQQEGNQETTSGP
jgi:hypothetical protein